MSLKNEPSLWLSKLPVLQPDGHKYGRGCAVVFGGEQMTGAARLAALASMRIGAGLCILSAPKASVPVYAATLPAHIIVEEFHDVKDALADERRNAVVIGPGLGKNRKRAVVDVVHSGRAGVLDADALTQFEEDPDRFLKEIPSTFVLTPHEGEFLRLFPKIKGDRIARAVAAAEAAECTVVLKGAETVIASPGMSPVVNNIDAPMLATAGSGDVLSGMIGGLLAQGMDSYAAACAAVYIHAMAAKAFGVGLVASDLPDMIPSAIKDLS
jgi:ADP-dependent NAD(P)H-hydrate dehydratase / NAD(P)H-hydrate epimerase